MSTSPPYGKRVIALALSALMTFSPLLSGCTQQTTSTDASDDEGKSEMTANEEDQGTIKVDYNAQGNYTVTIKESDLIKLEVEANDDEGKQVEDDAMGEANDSSSSSSSDAASSDSSQAASTEAATTSEVTPETTNEAKPEATPEATPETKPETTAEATPEQTNTEELDKKYAAEGKEGYTYKGLSGDQPQWEPIEFTVKYEGELAKPIDEAKATYETSLTLAEPDAREGYTFVGWATAEQKPAEGAENNPPYLVFPAKTVFERNLACAFDVNGDGKIDGDEQAKLIQYATDDHQVKLYAQWNSTSENNNSKNENSGGEAANNDSNANAAATVKFSDLKQEDVAVTYEFAPPSEENATAEPRAARINEFKNENGSMTISYNDPDAAANDTDMYYVLFNGMDSIAAVEVNIKEYQLTAETKSVRCDSDSHTITLKVEGTEFADGVSANDITLGGSFKEMQVAEVSPSGSSLTLKLTGTPALDTKLSTTYTAGQITVKEAGFKNGTQDDTAYVDVEIPAAAIDVSGIKVGGGSVTAPMYIEGVDPKDVSAGDISFSSGVQVTEAKADGDKLQITVATDNVDQLAGQMTVKGQEYPSSVTHAEFDADLDYIGSKDDKFEITLLLTADDGTFANDLSTDKVSLADGFADGSVSSIERQDDTNAKLTISVPSNGKTTDNYNFVGTVTLAQGALVDDWGGAAPEYSYATYYAANDEGKDAESDKEAAAKAKEEKQQKKQDKVDRASKVVEYGVDALNFVGGDAAVVGAYCLDVFKIAASAYMGDIGGVASAIGSIVKRAGLLDGGEDPNAPSAQSVEDKMDELKNLLSTMDQRMDAMEKNQYELLVRNFDNALDAIASDCSRAESMLRGAKQIYVQQGKTVPAENASQEELLAYNHELIDIIEKQEKDGDRSFKNYSSLISRIENNYITATTEAKKDWNHNPFHYYDKRVAGYFNWETQGWYMRETYRTFAKFQITRAYNTLALYYEIPQNADRYKDITERFAKSLQTIEDHPSGLAPTDWKEGEAVYSETLKRSASKFSVSDTNKDNNYVGDNEVNAYKNRLHDKSVQDDLALAFPAAKGTFESVKDTGVGMGGKWTKSKVRVRVNIKKLLNLDVFKPGARIPRDNGYYVSLGKEKIYFERILYWNGDFKSVKTQDRKEGVTIKFVVLE